MPVQRPRILRQPRADGAFVDGMDEMCRGAPVAERPADNDEPVLDELIHECGVLGETVLLPDAARAVPCRPVDQRAQKVGHARRIGTDADDGSGRRCDEVVGNPGVLDAVDQVSVPHANRAPAEPVRPRCPQRFDAPEIAVNVPAMSDDLYRLLGLPADTPPTRLRQVYEEHVTNAVRSSDHRRALALSTALDNLDPAIRARLYPRLTTQSPGASAARPTGRSTSRRSVTRRTGLPRPRSGRRAVVYIAVALGISGLIYLDVVQSKRPTSAVPVRRSSPPTSSYSTQFDSSSGHFRPAVRDARVAVRAVDQCRATTGSLPPSAPIQSGSATLRCGDGAIALDLQTGNELAYTRINARHYTLTVTAPDGRSARYDSRTGVFSR